MTARVLVVDNFDSFVYNLVQYLGQLGVDSVVRRNDAVTVEELADLDVAGVLLSPGPGTPTDAGVTVPMVRAAAEVGVPVLGVCLGHQAIAEAFGGDVVRAPELLHGKTSQVVHEGAGVLADLPSPFTATRYHSLAVESATVPAELEVTGRTPSGIVMALRHRELPIEGVQFHPESVLTEGGHQLLATWLGQCGLAPDPALVESASAAAKRLLTAVPRSGGPEVPRRRTLPVPPTGGVEGRGPSPRREQRRSAGRGTARGRGASGGSRCHWVGCPGMGMPVPVAGAEVVVGAAVVVVSVGTGTAMSTVICSSAVAWSPAPGSVPMAWPSATSLLSAFCWVTLVKPAACRVARAWS